FLFLCIRFLFLFLIGFILSLSIYKNGVSLILFFQVCSSPLSGTEGSELCIRADSSFSCESPVLFGRGREDSKNTQNHSRAWSNQLANLRGSERNWKKLRSPKLVGARRE
ncbi:unnamed protein product, partial [Linum tenue]